MNVEEQLLSCLSCWRHVGRVPAERTCRLHSRLDVVNVSGQQRTHRGGLLKKHLQEVREKESEKAKMVGWHH